MNKHAIIGTIQGLAIAAAFLSTFAVGALYGHGLALGTSDIQPPAPIVHRGGLLYDNVPFKK